MRLAIGNPGPGVALWSIVGLDACELALMIVLMVAGYVHPFIGNNAEHVYLPAATRILTTGTFSDRTSFGYSTQAPGYPFFLAAIQAISARWYLRLIVCFQMLLNGSIALVLLFLGKRTTSLRAGWLAGILWLLFPPSLVISTWVTAETLFTALFVLSMVMWIESLSEADGLTLSFFSGLGLGVTTLVRATTQLLPVFMFATVFFRRTAKVLPKCILLLAGTCLVILPWFLRNLAFLGEPVIVQTGFGAVVLQGSRSEYFTISGKDQHYPVLFQQAAKAGLPEPTDRDVVSLDRWRLALGLRNYRIRLHQEPMSFLPFFLHKFARLWYGAETGTFSKQLILGICSLLVLPVGIFQIWRWRRDQPLLSIVFSLVIVYFVALHLVGLPEFRYVLPICPFLVFSASHQYLHMFQAGAGAFWNSSAAPAPESLSAGEGK